MSAIGDYVHFFKKDYAKFGIMKKWGEGVNLLSAVQDYNQDRLFKSGYTLNRSKNSQVLKDFQDFLNNDKKKVLKEKNIDEKELAQRVIETFSKSTAETLERIDISAFDLNTVSLQGIKISDAAIGKIATNRGNKLTEDRARNWVKKILLAGKALETLAADTVVNGTQENIKTLLKIYQDLLRQGIVDVQDGIKEKVKDSQIYSKLLNDAIVNSGSNVSIGELRNLFNELVQVYFKAPPLNDIEGKLWEHYLAAVIKGAVATGQTGILECVHLALPEQIIDEALLKTMANSNTKEVQVFNSDGISVISRQNLHTRKTDVTAQWVLDGAGGKLAEELNISAKNISSRVGKGNSSIARLSLTSNQPMSVMLGGLEEGFVTHYLNLVTSSSGGGGLGKNIKDDNGNTLDSISKEAVIRMKFALLQQAMTGGMYVDGEDRADVFVINDKRTGRVTVLDMAQMLNKMIEKGFLSKGSIISSPLLSSATVRDSTSGKNLLNLHFKQDWAGDKKSKADASLSGANARIRSLTAALHSVKIEAALNNVTLN